MYKAINGWTKNEMIAKINKEFKGKSFKYIGYGGTSCLYRGKNGKKCAVGIFLPDELYKEYFNESTIHVLLYNIPEFKKIMPLNIKGMEIFQHHHDNISTKHFKTIKSQKKKLVDWVKENVE